MADGTVVHWFRKGLRLHDNPAFLHCLKEVHGSQLELRPLFILDKCIPLTMKIGPNRWRFLQQSLQDLDNNLQKLETRLFVVRGKPEEVFETLIKKWNIKMITFESDIEPYAVKRDTLIEDLAQRNGIKVHKESTHNLFDPHEIIKMNGGMAPLTYAKFRSTLESLGNPKLPVAAPTEIPTGSRLKDGIFLQSEHNVPTLSELGIDDESLGECLYPGGETAALTRMDKYLSNKSWVCKFEKPMTSPNSLEPSTTVLSPYIKFGCLSSRMFYYRIKEVIDKAPHSSPPVSLLGQLLWREFYYTVASVTPNFDKIMGNPICYQIPWKENEEHLKAWTHGKTGYPFIDAIMRQLKQEGWIHHLARHAVACFLTRGDLWISWEEGQKVFEEFLIDADWALNAGNWMWLSASAFFHHFFKVYSPVNFGKKTDPTGKYIRKFVPELKEYPDQYIYEPWKAPLITQKEASCILGEDYPRRIVVHETVHKLNIKKMSTAYKNNKPELTATSMKQKGNNESETPTKRKKK